VFGARAGEEGCVLNYAPRTALISNSKFQIPACYSRVRGVRAEIRRAFPRKRYRRRALIETLFSSVKRKLSARAPRRSLRMQMRQTLLLGLSFNLYRLKRRYFPRGCQQSQRITEICSCEFPLPKVPQTRIKRFLRLLLGCLADVRI
jgi:hypothetical protein